MLHKFTALFLTLCIALTCFVSAAEPAETQTSLRGVWVSSVYNLDYPSTPSTDASALKQQADQILDNAARMGYNAIFLQVRPSCDALYDSDLFPWSRFLTGTIDTAPADNFDPLSYWVSGAHKRGLALHAWINPYRITRSKEAEWNKLPSTSPAVQHPDWVVRHTDGNYYFNPGVPEVTDFVCKGAAEIATNYDVDGIHLDDYFYPGTDFADADTFARYGAGFESIADWRRDNVNRMVASLSETIHQINPSLSFGISPSGIWDNLKDNPKGSNTRGHSSYSQCYADSLYWMEHDLIDYICPQIYWNIGYSIADFNILIDWWSAAAKRTGTTLYIGLAGYRTAEATNAVSVWYGGDEIIRQLAVLSDNPYVSGSIMFRYGSLTSCTALQNKVVSYFSEHAPTLPQTPTFWSVFLSFLRAVAE